MVYKQYKSEVGPSDDDKIVLELVYFHTNILFGVMKNLIELLNMPGMDTYEKQKKITWMREPAYNIELDTIAYC